MELLVQTILRPILKELSAQIISLLLYHITQINKKQGFWILVNFLYLTVDIPTNLLILLVFNLHTSHYISPLPIAFSYCLLHFPTAYCLFPNAFSYCLLPVWYYPLPTTHCPVKYSFVIIYVKSSSTHRMKLASVTTSRKP